MVRFFKRFTIDSKTYINMLKKSLQEFMLQV